MLPKLETIDTLDFLGRAYVHFAIQLKMSLIL